MAIFYLSNYKIYHPWYILQQFMWILQTFFVI